MKIGDLISLNTVTDGKKEKVVHKTYSNKKLKVTKKSFEIIGQTHYLTKDTKIIAYFILVPDSYTGWIISPFHVLYCDVPKKFLGKKFREVGPVYFK